MVFIRLKFKYKDSVFGNDLQVDTFGKTYLTGHSELETDLVTATLCNFATGFDVSKVYFKTAFGLVMETVRSGNTFTLNLPAAKTNQGYELFAYADVNGKPQVLGKLDVLTFPFVRPKVCLVPVRVEGKEPIAPNIKEVSEKLNAIYRKYGVEFEVSLSKTFDDQEGWDYDGDGKLDISGTGLFSNLSDEMKALAIAYRTKLDSAYNKNTSYLFVLNDSKSDADAALSPKGDMPRGHQFGYLFGEVDERTLAHELSHGVFKLKHTFDADYSIKQSSTDNLMDYAGGLALTQTQWRAVHDPGLVIGVFETDGDALDIDDSNILNLNESSFNCNAPKPPDYRTAPEGFSKTTSLVTEIIYTNYGTLIEKRCYNVWYYFQGNILVKELHGWYIL